MKLAWILESLLYLMFCGWTLVWFFWWWIEMEDSIEQRSSSCLDCTDTADEAGSWTWISKSYLILWAIYSEASKFVVVVECRSESDHFCTIQWTCVPLLWSDNVLRPASTLNGAKLWKNLSTGLNVKQDSETVCSSCFNKVSMSSLYKDIEARCLDLLTLSRNWSILQHYSCI